MIEIQIENNFSKCCFFLNKGLPCNLLVRVSNYFLLALSGSLILGQYLRPSFAFDIIIIQAKTDCKSVDYWRKGRRPPTRNPVDFLHQKSTEKPPSSNNSIRCIHAIYPPPNIIYPPNFPSAHHRHQCATLSIICTFHLSCLHLILFLLFLLLKFS